MGPVLHVAATGLFVFGHIVALTGLLPCMPFALLDYRGGHYEKSQHNKTRER
jgi:hypothetical protein